MYVHFITDSYLDGTTERHSALLTGTRACYDRSNPYGCINDPRKETATATWSVR